MDLNASGPTLHRGGQSNWMIAEEVLDFLTKHVNEDSVTVETGAGYSTIVFSQLGAQHTAITPAADEAERITVYCAEQGIATDRTTFKIGYSQDVLPGLEITDLDLALIDGGHGFPIPAIDFFYLAPRLRVGGYLLIDDVDVWTGEMIVSVLKREPEWEFGGKLARRTAVFRKTAPFVAREWCDQPAVVARSRVRMFVRKAANGTEHLLKGDFKGVRERIERARNHYDVAHRFTAAQRGS